MKKVLVSLILLLSTLLFTTDVSASSFDVNIVGDDTFEGEITLYIQVNNLLDFNGACNGLCGLVGNLGYDTEKLELISISALESFDLTHGNTIVLYKSTGVASGTKILSMNFKNKSLAKDEVTTITFSNIVASDGDKDINASNTSKTIKFIVEEVENNNTNDNGSENINNNNNNNSNMVNNNNSSNINNKPITNILNKKEEIEKSNNNYLSSITLSNGSIKFDKDILTYDLVVDYEISTIQIESKTEDDRAVITGNGIHNLSVGSNVISLVVKAEDSSERTYTLNINRQKKEVIVEDNSEAIEKEEIENEIIKKENNYLIPIIIISLIIIGGIVVTAFLKKRSNK